jgi:mannose-1-phosphate guanylyltransferase
VGSWLALERMQSQDAGGNTVQATHCGLATRGCVLVADAGHLLATAGVQDLIIIQDGNVTLIADRKAEGDIKKLVESLKQMGLEQYL